MTDQYDINTLLQPAKNSSSPAFYKKHKSVRQWRTEKKFLELGLETAPKMYTCNPDDPSITMELIPGKRPHTLSPDWFALVKKQVKELNEVGDTTGWHDFLGGPYYHIEQTTKRLTYTRTVLGDIEEVQELTKLLDDECDRIKNIKWNNDNMILGSIDYGTHNTLYNPSKGEYRLVDFEYISYLELSTFAAKFWNQTHRHYWNMFGSPEDDSKLIEELSQYQVNDAWIEQYQNLKPIWSLQDKMWELVHRAR